MQPPTISNKLLKSLQEIFIPCFRSAGLPIYQNSGMFLHRKLMRQQVCHVLLVWNLEVTFTDWLNALINFPLIDNNECIAETNMCGSKGVCQNTPGSFQCECQRGYLLDQSGHGCEGNRITKKVTVYHSFQIIMIWLIINNVAFQSQHNKLCLNSYICIYYLFKMPRQYLVIMKWSKFQTWTILYHIQITYKYLHNRVKVNFMRKFVHFGFRFSNTSIFRYKLIRLYWDTANNEKCAYHKFLVDSWIKKLGRILTPKIVSSTSKRMVN